MLHLNVNLKAPGHEFLNEFLKDTKRLPEVEFLKEEFWKEEF